MIKSVRDVAGLNMVFKGKHLHASDARARERKHTLNSIKNAAKISRESARKIIAESTKLTTVATAATMPSVKSMTRMVGRIRQKSKFPKNPKTLKELELPEDFKKTTKGKDFLIFDNGAVDDRMLVFGTKKNLEFLSECPSIYMDGTFDVAPPLFQQVYTIHGMEHFRKIFDFLII